MLCSFCLFVPRIVFLKIFLFQPAHKIKDRAEDEGVKHDANRQQDPRNRDRGSWIRPKRQNHERNKREKENQQDFPNESRPEHEVQEDQDRLHGRRDEDAAPPQMFFAVRIAGRGQDRHFLFSSEKGSQMRLMSLIRPMRLILSRLSDRFSLSFPCRQFSCPFRGRRRCTPAGTSTSRRRPATSATAAASSR